jgi:predicted signal transduction protein with EAL and GGDEF domain
MRGYGRPRRLVAGAGASASVLVRFTGVAAVRIALFVCSRRDGGGVVKVVMRELHLGSRSCCRELDALCEPQLLDESARAGATGHPTAADTPSGLSPQVAELERLAHTDDLTGVLSRRAWIEHARQKLHTHQPETLLLCDVDDFKQVNDTFGHSAGDALNQFRDDPCDSVARDPRSRRSRGQ